MRKCALILYTLMCAIWPTAEEDVSMTLITAEGVPLELITSARIQ